LLDLFRDANANRIAFTANYHDALMSDPLPELAAMTLALPLTYPLTVSQSEVVVSLHNEDNARISGELDAIRATCEEKCASTTNKCSEHSKEVRRYWRTYYTNPRHGSWASYRSPEYLIEMRKMFDSKVDINKIHARAAKEKRMHYKDALCTIRINDDPDVKKYKREAAVMYDGSTPEAQIRDFLKKKEAKVAGQRTQKQLEYDSRLAACKSEEEKFVIYQEDACIPLDSDTPALTRLRIKWKALFEGNMPYSDIYASMQKDLEYHLRVERELNEKLDGLQRAKAAHDKVGIAKEMKKSAKEMALWMKVLSINTYYCSTEGCQNLAVPISLDEGVLQCAICDHLWGDCMQEHRTIYCGEECMNRDDNGVRVPSPTFPGRPTDIATAYPYHN
jgi:hypothetical protein